MMQRIQQVAAILAYVCVALFRGQAVEASNMPPSVELSALEPVRYVGADQPDKRYYDGALPHAVGVHAYQAFRANRTSAPEGGTVGWTYNHQPYLAYWKDRFYLQYLSNPEGEHMPPGRTLLMTSQNGRDWSNPQVVFPEYALPDISTGKRHLPAGTFSVMHQRMGFYVAPNGRLLTLGFYSYCLSQNPGDGPNAGQGLGRVVREIYPEHSFGPIYFIRYNRHAGWNETNTRYPFYQTSPDAEFVEACDALLADKLMTLQWWEEDRAEDGFFTVGTKAGVEPKAPSYAHRPDGAVLAVWKAHAALSPDEGGSWTPLVRLSSTLRPCNAKTWIQRTSDGRYALVYNHSAQQNRFPMVAMTSDNCMDCDNMLCLHAEVPPIRFTGHNKNIGSQYVRGIEEGNGSPPGSYMWNTFSMNKEDLWVTRTRVPISGTVIDNVNDTFDGVADASELELWNLYVPQWCAADITVDPEQRGNKCLELRDEEPYDYVKAERAFPKREQTSISFRVMAARIGHGVLEIEVQDGHGLRPLKLRLAEKWLYQAHMNRQADVLPVDACKWTEFRLDIDCRAGWYTLLVDGKEVSSKLALTEKVDTVERLVFRTGAAHRMVDSDFVEYEPCPFGYVREDLPGADQRVPLSVYRVDYVRTSTDEAGLAH